MYKKLKFTFIVCKSKHGFLNIPRVLQIYVLFFQDFLSQDMQLWCPLILRTLSNLIAIRRYDGYKTLCFVHSFKVIGCPLSEKEPMTTFVLLSSLIIFIPFSKSIKSSTSPHPFFDSNHYLFSSSKSTLYPENCKW